MNAAAADAEAYSIAAGDVDRDREAVIALWRATLGNADGRDLKYDWFYRDAPEPPLLQVLRHGTQVVGTAGVGWRRMRVDGRIVRAGLLADMAVLAGHRMLGPALLLQRSACERALDEGDLVYGFPNPNAVPVVKRLGYAHIGDMAVHVRALRHGAYLARRLPLALSVPAGGLADIAIGCRDRIRTFFGKRIRAEWRDAPHDTFHDASPPAFQGMEGIRDRATLEWRFTRCPLARFRFLYLQRDGEPRPFAWFACHHDGDVMRVADFRISDAASATHALATLARIAYRAGCRSLSVEACLPADEARMLLANGFRERQRRPVYGKWRRPSDAPPGPIRMTAFDEDE